MGPYTRSEWLEVHVLSEKLYFYYISACRVYYCGSCFLHFPLRSEMPFEFYRSLLHGLIRLYLLNIYPNGY